MNLLQSSCHAMAMRAIGWSVYGSPGEQIFYKSLGPVCAAKYQRPARLDPAYLTRFRRQFHPLLTIVEPNVDSTFADGLPISPYSHTATALLDLKLSEHDFLESFSAKTRYNIIHTKKLGMLTTRYCPLSALSKKIRSDFFSLRSVWNSSKGDVGYDLRFLSAILTSYRDHGYIHVAYHRQTPVASLLTLTCDLTATYYTAYSTATGNHHFAPTLLTWESILRAKELGCKKFDFGGIYDDRYPKRYRGWEGFTKFKQGFRPTYVEYPPSRLQLFW